MDTVRINLLTVLILCSGLCTVDSGTVNAVISPSLSIKGSNEQIISCDFVLETGEIYRSLGLREQGGSVNIVTLFNVGDKPEWSSAAPADLKERGTLSSDTGTLSLTLNDTVCSDDGKSYTCVFAYSVNGGSYITTDDTTNTAVVEAKPLAPNEMVVTPNSEDVTEYSEMTFECQGNVGRPAGSFQWFMFTGTSGQEITEGITSTDAVASGDGCTFNKTSRVTMNLTRTEPDQRLVIRCRVNAKHGNVDQTACTNPDEDYCRMSQQISVQYPVSVRVSSDTVTVTEDTDQVIDCLTLGNPLPHLVEWRREGSNDTLVSGKLLTLRKVTENDSGNYVCTAYNTVAGVTMEDSITVTISVVKKPTIPPTSPTLPTSTTETNGGGNTSSNTAGGDSTTIIIIVVVVVVVVVVTVIIIIVVVIKKRQKNPKAMLESGGAPEKTFSSPVMNQPKPAQPDLVNNFSNLNGYKNEDGLEYAELQFDNKPRSRRPLALDDSHTDYSDVSMPQV